MTDTDTLRAEIERLIARGLADLCGEYRDEAVDPAYLNDTAHITDAVLAALSARLDTATAERDAALTEVDRLCAQAPPEELRALSEAATPGPWDAVAGAYGDPSNGPDHMRVVQSPHRTAYDAIARMEYDQHGGADAAFIAAAVNHVRAALDQEGRP